MRMLSTKVKWHAKLRRSTSFKHFPVMMISMPRAILLLTLLIRSGMADVGVVNINKFIEQKWKLAEVQPAPTASDEVFVRRVFLDLVGRIPRVEERQTFLDDKRPDKREHLIDVLLASEDYVQHMADNFDTLLMGRGKSQDYKQRQQHKWRSWLERVFRENRPWDEVVADMLLARPQSQQDEGAVWYLYERKDKHQEIAEAVAPAVFGIRIECAQCHDHMVAFEIEQAHYWGLVAFFNRSKNIQTKNGPRVSESAIGGFSEFANLEGNSTPNFLTFFKADQVEEQRPEKDAKEENSDELYQPASIEGDPRVPKFSRREKFVNEIVADHPLVAKAFVNRVWALMMGRGIVHPFDEMDSTHPPSHPELLDWLAEDFQNSGMDIRRLVKQLVQSRPYQLEARKPHGVDDPALFAWYLERPLTAEQLARSMQLALHGAFRNDHPVLTRLRDAFPQIIPETVGSTVSDALFLSNHADFQKFITTSTSVGHLVANLRELPDRKSQIDLLYLTIYGRNPEPDETSRMIHFLGETSDNAKRWQSVIWAMITSAEFMINH